MRRLIAYIITALAMLLAIGVGATPVITKLNSGREFTSGKSYREIVFKVEDESATPNPDRAKDVAEEMKSRLKDYNVEDYSIKVQGEDTVTVALDMSSKEYNYAAKYLAFQGESFALVSSNGNSESVRAEDKLFDADDIRIEYKGDAKVPVIVIPVTEAGKKDVEDLVNEFNDDSDSSKSIIKRSNLSFDGEDEDGEEEAEKQNLLYLWANFDEDRNEGYDTLEKDPIAREKVLMAFNVDNIWYEDAKKDETALFYMCATADKENSNQLDISGLKDDNARANYLVGLLKASKYGYEISCPTMNITTSGVDYFENARVLTASAEPLLSLGNNVTIKMSKTFIATLIAIFIVSLLLIVYYRLSALAIITTSLGTIFLTLISFTSMHVLFNIPAVVGLIILYSGALFGEMVYVNRFKDEVYKGRSLKKANQEASKRSNLLTLDSVIVLAFTGLMMYALGGTALKPMGVVLFFGGVFILIMNLLVFKLLMYLVTNSSNLQSKYSVFNIDGEKVPNILATTEEKPTYEAPYEKVDFTKKKSVVSIVLGALSAAALACIVVFGVTSPTKSPLNVQKAVADTTVIYASVKADSETPLIHDGDSFVTYVLKDTKYAEVEGISQEVEAKKVSQYVYESSEDDKTETYYFFTLNVNEKLDSETLEGIEKTMTDNLEELFGAGEDELTYARVRNSEELIYTPSQGFVALATGISIVGISLYFAFRFRPSRGIAVCAVAIGSSLIAYGSIVAMRFIGTTALTSLAIPVVAVSVLLASLFFLSTEKAMLKESNLVLTPELRKEIMVKAIGKSASALFVFMLVSMYVIINFFGFGVDNTAILFASALLGDIVGVIALLVIFGPLASVLEKAFSKIHLPKIKWFRKEKAKQQVKRNSSEPEETIFIGIND